MAELLKIGPETGRDEGRMALAKMLMQSGPFNNNHWTGPVADAAAKLSGAWLHKSALDDQTKDRAQAMAAILKGGTAQPWTDPDSGQVDPQGYGAGGVNGMLEALQEMPENRFAQDLLPGLLSDKIAQEQAARQRRAEIEREEYLYKRGRRDSAEDWQRDRTAETEDAANAHDRALALKSAPGWQAPRQPVPGVDLPLPEAVFQQKKDLAEAQTAARLSAQGTWDDDPNDPDMQVNSVTGERKEKPATPRRLAERALPDISRETHYLVGLVSDLVDHPGMPGVVGWGNVSGTLGIPGTDEAGFRSRLAQLEGKQFLQAYQSLKDGGAITEVEGRKAEAAISRLQQVNQKEEEYRQAAREFQEIIWGGLNRAREKAGQPPLPMPDGSMVPAASGGWSIKRAQ